MGSLKKRPTIILPQGKFRFLWSLFANLSLPLVDDAAYARMLLPLPARAAAGAPSLRVDLARGDAKQVGDDDDVRQGVHLVGTYRVSRRRPGYCR